MLLHSFWCARCYFFPPTWRALQLAFAVRTYTQAQGGEEEEEQEEKEKERNGNWGKVAGLWQQQQPPLAMAVAAAAASAATVARRHKQMSQGSSPRWCSKIIKLCSDGRLGLQEKDS